MIPDEQVVQEDRIRRLLLGAEEARGDASSAELEQGLSPESAQKLSRMRRAVELLHSVAQKSSAEYALQGKSSETLTALVGKSDEPNSDSFEFRPSNRYQLISRLGQGGFGVVFLARDQHLNRNVALKMPRPDVLLTKSMVQRFLREARNVAKLDHPNIVPVLATDETALMPSIVYPYCSGPTLATWL
ncbi:MAG: protein kinase, partial [Pirellulaceae bacterium]|nr:protein kinase [Pirellulaceae bacterium]